MRAPAAALVAVSLLVAGAGGSSAAAPPPVLDGKKVKNLKVVQESPTDAVGVADPAPADVAACQAPRCARVDFVYKPAKGVKAPLSVHHKQFYVATTDTDLYLMQGTQVVAACTGMVSNARYVQVEAAKLKPGSTYSAIMYYSHSTGETTTMNVDLPGVASRDAQYVDPADVFQTSLTMCGT